MPQYLGSQDHSPTRLLLSFLSASHLFFICLLLLDYTCRKPSIASAGYSMDHGLILSNKSISAEFQRKIKIIHPNSVILVFQIVKEEKHPRMKWRATVVSNKFFSNRYITEKKQYVYPLSHIASVRNPSPSHL